MLKVFDTKFPFSKLFHFLERDDITRDLETAAKMRVKDVMSKNPVTVKPEDSIYDAAFLMHSKGFNRLPVVDDDGKLVGIVTRADILSVL